jgi:hypothetical protein
LTEEDLVALQQKKTSTKVEKGVPKRAATRKVVAMEESGLNGTPTNASDAIHCAPFQSPQLPFLFRALEEEHRRQLALRAQRERETVAYYCGPGRRHLFCLIVRIKNLEEEKDRSAPHDYICVLTLRHTDLNGCGALLLTEELLSAIRYNSGSLRCELQNGASLRDQEVENVDSPLLKSIITTTSISTTLKEPEFLPSDWLFFENHGMSPRNNWLIARIRQSHLHP